MRAQAEFNDIMSLEEKIRMLPNRAEKTINRVLHTRGIEIATREMTNFCQSHVLVLKNMRKKVSGPQVRWPI